MEYTKRIFVTVLVILTLNLYLPKMALAQQQFVSADVPKHEPQSWGTPEENIPTVKKKTSGWTWSILVALIGGAALLLAQKDDKPTPTPPPDTETGSYTASW